MPAPSASTAIPVPWSLPEPANQGCVGDAYPAGGKLGNPEPYRILRGLRCRPQTDLWMQIDPSNKYWPSGPNAIAAIESACAPPI